MTRDELQQALDDMIPLILELDDWSGVAARAFVVADGLIWVYSNPETKPVPVSFTETYQVPRGGIQLVSPDYLLAVLYPVHGQIDPGLADEMAALAEDWTPELVQAQYDEQHGKQAA